ncbi:MAG: hypothetical protein HYV07_30195 [Deltaproteobacteria bacterium]|nr:hypothetical protein [Deltaproteobacteria bacterium]
MTNKLHLTTSFALLTSSLCLACGGSEHDERADAVLDEESPDSDPQPAATDPSSPPASTPGATNSPSTSNSNSWGLAFDAPSGWQKKSESTCTLMQGGTPSDLMIACPALARQPEELIGAASSYLPRFGLQVGPASQQTRSFGGRQGITASAQAMDAQGMVYQLSLAGVVTEHGTGLIVFAIGNDGAARASQVAESLRATPPQVNSSLVQALTGTWIYWNGRTSATTSVTGGYGYSYEETLRFDGVGMFSYSTSASNYANTGNGASAGGATAQGDSGTYTVIGTDLVAIGRSGTQFVSGFALTSNGLDIGGKVYARQ